MLQLVLLLLSLAAPDGRQSLDPNGSPTSDNAHNLDPDG